ncbi:MAG: glycoside hydrolase family 3 N-terminal domain-containing protein, partial [Pseudomonadota bacterium]
ADGLGAGGVAPVIKHIPGHGRATADSHKALPTVDAPLSALEATDFAPFQALADLPIGMTAHIRYTALDAERPLTTSATAVAGAVRQAIGFDGLLLTDDLCMHALGGGMDDRAARSLAAGCDIALHCDGTLDGGRAAAAGAQRLNAEGWRRWTAVRDWMAARRDPAPFDERAAFVELTALTGAADGAAA